MMMSAFDPMEFVVTPEQTWIIWEYGPQLRRIYTDGRGHLPVEERFNATLKLAQLPRNGAAVRVRLRCALTGRSRGNYRKFKLCRIALRDLASSGQIPGMVKASW